MHILLADDDALSRLILKKAVERLGHSCVTVNDGREAWARVRLESFDVVISDWMMPDMDGLELCQRIRAEEGAGGYTYFVLLTANDERQDRLRGMRAGADDYLTKPLDPHDLQLRLIAGQRISRLHQQIVQQKKELESLNQTLFVEGRRDALTGIPNRLALHDDLAKALSRSQRGEATFCIGLFDIDNFKLYNDNYGHLAGDETLREVAQALEAACRAGDAVYRYGGEEFCALFHDQSLDNATIAVERMRAAVQAVQREHPLNTAAPVVTVSCGVALHNGNPSLSAEDVLDHADQALYVSKESGRNLVTVSRKDQRVLLKSA